MAYGVGPRAAGGCGLQESTSHTESHPEEAAAVCAEKPRQDMVFSMLEKNTEYWMGLQLCLGVENEKKEKKLP